MGSSRREAGATTMGMKQCVIFNSAAARGKAPARIEPIRQALGAEATFQATERPGHAEELAYAAAQAGFDIVAAAGGDGTVHEVANGILRANQPNVAFAVYPIGSANDYAFALGLKLDMFLSGKATPRIRHVDVAHVRAETGRERYFINSLGLGFNGWVTIEARKIRWLRGLPLYTLAFFKALLFHYQCQPMEIRLDDDVRNVRTFAFTAAIGQREGNLLLTPHAVLDDGLFDYLLAGPLSRFEVIRHLPKLATGADLPPNHPALWSGRCQSVNVRSETPLIVHLEGEFFCLPEDGIRQLDITMLPRKLPVWCW